MLIQCSNCLDILNTSNYYHYCKCFSNTEENTGLFVDSIGDGYYRIGGNLKHAIYLSENIGANNEKT